MTEEYERYCRAQAARWLEHVMSLGTRVRALQAEIDAQRELASGVKGMSYDGMPGPKTAYGDALPDAVARIEDMVACYCTELAGYVDEQREAHAALAGMEDEACRSAITRHYLACESWERVCVEMGYTWDGLMKLRRRAMLDAYEVMPIRWRDPIHRAV